MSNLIVARKLKIAQKIQSGLNYEGIITNAIAFDSLSGIDLEKFVFNSTLIIFIAIDSADLDLAEKLILDKKYLVLINNSGINHSDTLSARTIYQMPVNYRELADEIRKERYSKSIVNNETLKYKSIELCTEKWEVLIEGVKIKLRNKEFVLLKFLLQNTNKVLTRVNLIESLWDINANAFTNTVDVHIGKLRKIFNKFDSTRGILQTINCVGYIMK